MTEAYRGALRWRMCMTLVCATWAFVCPASAGTFPADADFRVSPGIYEPSGVVQLPDGRLLVVEDEGSRPFRLITLEPDGELRLVPLKREALLRGRVGLRGLGKLSDMEALAIDADGRVYGTGSFSRTDRIGRVNSAREKLVRFRVQDERVMDSAVVTGLKRYMTEASAVLREAATARGAKDTGGLNVEGLTFDRSGEALWFGFRSPLDKGQAIILALENPAAVFEDETPVLRKILVDLAGAGIRGLTYVPSLDRYLIVARPEEGNDRSQQLFSWTGETSDSARRVVIHRLDSLRRAEGIAPIALDAGSGLLIFSDEGSSSKRQPGRYLLLSYDRLSGLSPIHSGDPSQ